MTLTDNEVSLCMDGMSCITLTERRGRETPFEHLDAMYLHASNAREQMEQFTKGYQKLVQDTVNQYKSQLPGDVLSDSRIQQAI